MVQKQKAKYWLAIGVLIGLGLEMKHTMIVYVLALLAGMLLTKAGPLLWNRWSVYGGLLADASCCPICSGITRMIFLRWNFIKMPW
jgi:4-amino-4-deoxy-L-arabinose transferase-like glycosyltransferase